MKKPTVTIELIGPKEASALLERRSELQRTRFSRAIADKYAGAMRAGAWTLVGDSIDIDIDGNLTNGQHRLDGVVKSGLPQQFTVCRGVALDAFAKRDRGYSRTAGQIMGMSGFSNTNVLAAAARIIAREEAGLIEGTWHDRYEPDALLDVVARHPGLCDSARVATTATHAFRCNKSVMTWAHYRFSQIDRDRADAFFRMLGDGANLAANDPILRLRNRLTALGSVRTGATMRDLAIMIVRSWNAHMQGRQVNVIRASIAPQGERGGSIRSPFPKIAA